MAADHSQSPNKLHPDDTCGCFSFSAHNGSGIYSCVETCRDCNASAAYCPYCPTCLGNGVTLVPCPHGTTDQVHAVSYAAHESPNNPSSSGGSGGPGSLSPSGGLHNSGGSSSGSDRSRDLNRRHHTSTSRQDRRRN